MKRTYLALALLAAAGSTAPATLPPLARAAALFQSQPLDPSRFSVLARPVGQDDWNLLVLEQIASAPRCWTPLADGLVEPSLNSFDYTGICSRYLDSNGYSLRVGEQDLATSHRLRLLQQGNELQLQALSPNETTVLVVGRAVVPRRDRDNFVAIQLNPGWELQRRAFGQQALNHIYFTNASPLRQLIAQANANSGQHARAEGMRGERGLASLPPLPPAVPAPAPIRAPQRRTAREVPSTSSRQQLQPRRLQEQRAETVALPGRAIALQVIPFQD